MNEDELAFHNAMVNVYLEAKKQCGYNATRFLQMVAERGGLETARHLLAESETQTGFEELWRHNRLDLSVENLVLQEKWRGLFADDELRRAREMLLAHGFDPDTNSL